MEVVLLTTHAHDIEATRTGHRPSRLAKTRDAGHVLHVLTGKLVSSKDCLPGMSTKHVKD